MLLTNIQRHEIVIKTYFKEKKKPNWYIHILTNRRVLIK